VHTAWQVFIQQPDSEITDRAKFADNWGTVSALNLHHSNSASKLNIPKR